MDKFYVEFAEILGEEEVKRDDELNGFEGWDSLSALEMVSMIDENYGIHIYNNEIKLFRTVGDIEDLIKEKMKSK